MTPQTLHDSGTVATAVLPIAAGAFEPVIGLVLRPEIAALSMSGFSFPVAMNALLLRRLRLPASISGVPAASGKERGK